MYFNHRDSFESSVVPLSLDMADIGWARVQEKDVSFRLEREKDRWFVVEGEPDEIRVAADSARIQGLFDAFSNLVPLDTVINNHAHASGDVGFKEVVLQFTLTPASKKSGSGDRDVKILLGRRTGNEGVWIWLSSAPGTLYRVRENILTAVGRPSGYYQDRRVLPFDASSAVKLQLAQKYAGGWTVARDDSGFVFELPAYLSGKDAANAEVKLYLLMLAGLEADEYLSGKAAPGEEPEAFINVWLEDAKNQPLRLDLYRDSSPGSGYMAMSSYQQGLFRFDAESIRQLFKTPFELQGRRVIELDIGKIAAIRVMSGDQLFIANKREQGWFVGDTEKQLAGIDMSLWRFNELKFEALPLKTLPETAAWTMGCVFSDAEGKKVASLTFFSDPALPEGQSWLKNGGELYYPVSNQLMKDLQGLFPAKSIS